MNEGSVIISAIALIAFLSIYKSVEFLTKRKEILAYYPFDVVLPNSPWVAALSYFIFIAAVLVSLYFLALKTNLIFFPA